MTLAAIPLRALVRLTSATGALVVATALVVAPAADARALAPTSRSHPYSDPVYYPLRVPARLDCVKRNPGCTAPHPNWMMDVVPSDQARRQSHAGVYAMGAGILHIGNAHGATCGKENSYGTWVWIDHGAGTLSRYGHLSKVVGKAGRRVAAGQQIGVVGTTGKIRNCHISYVNFSVQHKGLRTSHGVEIKTLRACRGSSTRTQSWPSAVHSRYRSWNATPQGTAFPASTNSCISSSAPRTATRPARVSLARHGKGKLRVRWSRPNASHHVGTIMVELSLWHPSKHYWDLVSHVRYITIPGTHASRTISKLAHKRLYRIRVSFHNSRGWSPASGWHKRTVK